MLPKLSLRGLVLGATAFLIGLAAPALTALAAPVPVPKVDPAPQESAPGAAQDNGDLKKQVEDALKELDKLEKILPEQPEQKKQIEEVRQGVRNQLIRIGNNGVVINQAFGPFGRSAGGRLGVSLTRPTAAMVEQLQLPNNQGLIVGIVYPGSAAAKAGIQKYDILLEIDGKPVSNVAVQFQRDIVDIKPDVEVSASIMRKGQKETIKGLKLPDIKAEAIRPQPIQIQPFPGQPGVQPGFQPGGPGVPNIQIVPPGGVGFGGIQIQPGGIQLPQGALPVIPPGGIGGFGGGVIQLQVNGNNAEAMAVSVTDNDFQVTYTSGGLKATVTGKRDNGKATPANITIADGETNVSARTIDGVPERYRATINRMLESVK